MNKRLSLNLSEGDQTRLDPYIAAGTNEHQVLVAWAKSHGLGGSIRSSAAALRVLLQAGIEAMSTDALELGYRQLAASDAWTEGSSDRRAARNRYAERAGL
jgi:hypothetical protein